MKKEIDIKIIKRELNETYDLHINDESLDWFLIDSDTVCVQLSHISRKLLGIQDDTYDDYQEVLNKYLVRPPLTEQELIACIAKHNGNWKVDWVNSWQYKYNFYLYFPTEHTITLETRFHLGSKERPTSHVMASEEVAQSVITELGEDRIIEFYKNW